MTKKKILIVDDEKPIVRTLTIKLNMAGFETKSVSDGEEALKILEKEKFDLILLDLVMPKIDGFTVLEEIAARKIKSKIVVTSNLSLEEDVQRAKKLGAVDYFVKSDVPIVEVVERIKKILKIYDL